MNLSEIIKSNLNPTDSILIELLIPYKKMLGLYYSDLFGCEPILMVTSVSNACQYGKIVPSDEFSEAVYEWMGVDYVDEDDTESDDFCEYETICANSQFWSKL